MKIEKNKLFKHLERGGEETMETKLAAKKARFLFNVEKAWKQLPSNSTVESTTVDNVILRDLVLLENIASSGSVSLVVDLDTNVNQSSGEGFIVLENPMTFAHSMN